MESQHCLYNPLQQRVAWLFEQRILARNKWIVDFGKMLFCKGGGGRVFIFPPFLYMQLYAIPIYKRQYSFVINN